MAKRDPSDELDSIIAKLLAQRIRSGKIGDIPLEDEMRGVRRRALMKLKLLYPEVERPAAPDEIAPGLSWEDIGARII